MRSAIFEPGRRDEVVEHVRGEVLLRPGARRSERALEVVAHDRLRAAEARAASRGGARASPAARSASQSRAMHELQDRRLDLPAAAVRGRAIDADADTAELDPPRGRLVEHRLDERRLDLDAARRLRRARSSARAAR